MENAEMNDLSERHSGEYLTFVLGTEEYAIDILKVQEIRGYEPPTQIANMPPFVKGVSNLRGTMVPIIDLRIKFNLPRVEYTPFTVVVILNLSERIIGIVVDSVSDVIELAPEQIRAAPQFSDTFDTKHIIGLASLDQRTLIVTDIERLMSGSEMGLISSA